MTDGHAPQVILDEGATGMVEAPAGYVEAWCACSKRPRATVEIEHPVGKEDDIDIFSAILDYS